MRLRTSLVLIASLSLWGCKTTKPGTHVELVDKGGNPVYVSGAAGPGINKSIACRAAVSRAAAAIALRFAQEHDDIGDDIADEVGASDGEVFLQRYAKQTAMDSAVQNVQFDPIEHICMATVRWQPPIFIKEALLKYAEKMKQDELSSTPGSEPAASSDAAPAAPAAAAAAAAAPRPSTPPPAAAVSVAPPAPSGPAVPSCTRDRSRLKKVLKSSQGALDDLAECKRRTKGDETICHRYVLYVEGAKKKEDAAGSKLAGCLNGGLSSSLRRALQDALPGHGAVSVETRGDGTVVLWAFSPVDQTSFAIEVTSSGDVAGKTPLAANQVQWVREQLGL